jgi:hypothetical protein
MYELFDQLLSLPSLGLEWSHADNLRGCGARGTTALLDAIYLGLNWMNEGGSQREEGLADRLQWWR